MTRRVPDGPAVPPGAFAPVGDLLVVDDGQRVVCHVCGRALGWRPGHLGRHGLDADRYREQSLALQLWLRPCMCEGFA